MTPLRAVGLYPASGKRPGDGRSCTKPAVPLLGLKIIGVKMNKQKKRIAITDTLPDFIENVLEFVSNQFDFELTRETDADYVFHSVDGYEVLKYPGVRIFVTGENVTPNFAVSDYAMAFDKLTFGDRYIWLPLIKLYRDSYKSLVSPRPPVDVVLRQKTDFCAYVMSNTKDSAEERTRIFDLLSRYKQVNSGGRWRNNIGGPVADKLSFQSTHKFVIAFENSSSLGYLTEKFADAAASNAIPIYWGDPSIGKLFNPKAFINCHDFVSLEDVVEEVKRVDQDAELYESMLTEQWFPNGIEPEILRDETFITFLTNIFDQDKKTAYRRNRSRWGLKTERRLYDMCHRPHVQGFILLRKLWRNIVRSFLPRRK